MDAPCRIRSAHPADARAVAVLELRCFSDPWSPDSFREAFSPGWNFGLILEQGTELLGYLVGRAVAGSGEILNVAVAPEHRRQGHARRLLDVIDVVMRRLHHHPYQRLLAVIWMDACQAPLVIGDAAIESDECRACLRQCRQYLLKIAGVIAAFARQRIDIIDGEGWLLATEHALRALKINQIDLPDMAEDFEARPALRTVAQGGRRLLRNMGEDAVPGLQGLFEHLKVLVADVEQVRSHEYSPIV